MVFGIAKGFGFDKRLQAELLVEFSEQSDILMKVFEFSDSMLEKTSGGIVAGIGVALLFWSVVKVLGSIEDAFNDIWKVAKPRSDRPEVQRLPLLRHGRARSSSSWRAA